MKLRRRYARLTDPVVIDTEPARTNATLDRKTVEVPIKAPYFVRKGTANRGWIVCGTLQMDERGRPWYHKAALIVTPAEGGQFWSGFGNFKTRRDACAAGVRSFGADFNPKL